MNPSIPQCKNCWKWGYAALSYRIQRAKCVKCNSLYKSENYYQFGWCCKGNDKINLPHLKNKNMSYICMFLSVQIAEVTIKQTLTYVYSRNIGSTGGIAQ